MGIVRTAEWLMTASPDETAAALREGLKSLDLEPTGEGTAFSAEAKRSLMKNRWAARYEVVVEPAAQGSVAVMKVEMNGNKHYQLLDELSDQVDALIDDRGVGAAVERLGKPGRVFGRKELRRIRHMLHGDETVLQLGQGQYGGKQGIVILTPRRLFFFEKSLGSQTVEEFPIKSISSVSVDSKLGGERLKVHSSGNASEIRMWHGQANEIARHIRNLGEQSPTTSSASSAPPDAIEQIKRLAELRDSGVLTDEEFAAKKAQLLEQL